MKFTKEILKNLQELAKIQCTKEEEESLAKDLQKILDHFNSLKEIDTENVPPCSFISNLQRNITRDDIPSKELSTELFLSNAQEKMAQMVKVPPILNKEE